MKNFNQSNGGAKMKSYILTLSIMITGLFGRATEPLTGWYYDQSTFQAFYMLSEITIDGEVAVGDGTSSPPNTSRSLFSRPLLLIICLHFFQ